MLLNPEGLIDSHDVVVRVNNYKIIEPATGKRADVFYSFFGQTIRKHKEDLKRDGVTLCMNKYPNAKPIQSTWHETRRRRRGIDFALTYSEREDWWFCPTYSPSAKDFMKIFFLLGKHVPTTGFAAIIEVLRMNPESVYLTGFDFFQSGKHNVDERWREVNANDPIRHVPLKERDWIRNNWNRYPLRGDDALLDQLGGDCTNDRPLPVSDCLDAGIDRSAIAAGAL